MAGASRGPFCAFFRSLSLVLRPLNSSTATVLYSLFLLAHAAACNTAAEIRPPQVLHGRQQGGFQTSRSLPSHFAQRARDCNFVQRARDCSDGRPHDNAEVARRIVPSLTNLTARRGPPLERTKASRTIVASGKPAPPRRAMALARIEALGPRSSRWIAREGSGGVRAAQAHRCDGEGAAHARLQAERPRVGRLRGPSC